MPTVTGENLNAFIQSELAKRNPDMSYQGHHKPMTEEGGSARLHDLAPAFGEDIYGKNALQYFGSGDAREKKVLEIMKQVKGKPDAMVTIYRGAPKSAKTINPGDWVTLHPEVAKEYASLEGYAEKQNGHVLEMKVPASHVTANADALLEQGYYPPQK